MDEPKPFQGPSDKSANRLWRTPDPEKAGDEPPAGDEAGGWDASHQNEAGAPEPEGGFLAEEDETYPEGGREAWLAIFGCWLILFSALGITNTLATLQTYVSEHQLSDRSPGTIGWVFSLYAFLCFFLGIYVGPLFDKYGPRWLVIPGTAGFITGLMLLSICTELWHFILCFGVLCGVSTSFLFTPSIAAVGHFFSQRRGLATGLASTGGSIGGIIFPLMLQSLFERVGWAWAVRTVGFLCLALCSIGAALIRSRLPPAKNASAQPDFRIFRNPAFLFTTIAVFLIEMALFIPLTYISSYARHEGFSESFSFQVAPILNAGSVLGRVIPGYWADKAGPFNSNMLMAAMCMVTCLAVWLPGGHTTAGLIVFALSFGFASGSNIGLTPVCVGRLCRTQEYGRYYATCYTVVAFACLVGVPIGGTILSATGGDYWGLIVFTGLAYCGAMVAFYTAKVSRVGWSLTAKF